MSNWTFSQTFGAQFQVSRSDLESRIDVVKSSSSVDQDTLQQLNIELAKLTKSLGDATGSLPSYDQRQYEQQLKTLEKILAELQSLLKPQSKFAFKRKPQPPPVTTAKPKGIEDLPPSSSVDYTPSKNLTLSSRSYQYITFDSLPQSDTQQDLTISDLDHCIVNFIPPTSGITQGGMSHPKFDISALHVRNLSDTILLLPLIDGSVLLHNLLRCKLVLGCRQFRMHTSHNIDVFLSISSNPIIEDCSDIRFAGYPVSLNPSLEQGNKHLSVLDFSHIRPTPSPHWSIMTDISTETISWPLAVVSGRKELCDVLENFCNK